MRVPAFLDRRVPASSGHVPGWLRVASVPVVIAVVLLGIWVTGGVVSDDFVVSMLLTGAFLAITALVALLVALRWRTLAVPVLTTFAVVAGGSGGLLLVTSQRDVIVNEDAAAAAAMVVPPPSSTGSATPESRRSTDAPPVVLGRGGFRSRAHPTRGAATLVQLTDGTRVLTLTNFDTDPGPDLRVYLVPGDGATVKGYRDLGRLKGNRSNQRYAIPANVDVNRYGAVVVWCRAFSVAFGSAELT